MEIIRKQISIDACRSHKQGLLPFIHSIQAERVDDTSNENTNYSHFVCDLSGETKVIKYLDIIRRYNELKDIIRKGIYCQGDSNTLKICEKHDISNIDCENKCHCDNVVFNYKPLDINNFTKKDYNRYNSLIDFEIEDGKCYILINSYNVYENYEKWGVNNKLTTNVLGDYFTFMQYVENNLIFNNNAEGFELITPTVDIPILLEEDYNMDTMYYPYEYTYKGCDVIVKINDEEFSGITGEENTEIIDIDKINLGRCEFSAFTDSPIIVESKLQSLIHSSAINLGYNSVIEKDVFGIPVGDAKLIDENKNSITDETLLEYKKILFKSGIKDKVNYLVEYYNDNDIITLPFLSDIPINIEDGKCDVVTKIDKDTENGYVIIEYIIGATLNGGRYDERTGIHYQEKLKLYSEEIVIELDNVLYENVKYEYVDYDTNIETVYNKEYNTYIDIRKAEIIGMPIGSIYNIDKPIEKKEDGEWKIQKPLIFTKEGSDSLISTPKIDIDLTFNRGNAAGWEKHFKLSECNTMQDLENYGNNFFNL